ncbi:hypothetical protein WN944_015042 [Citrus x changshan-huyou]|uniref:cytokinin riboside 5'-monophosphate phosphoribohydrolase n=1 Tax=Citrus x changshan-huyou TaxID=2935761 RepID=A0AAP0QM55_9ROSI
MAAASSKQLKNICVLSGFRYRKYKEFVQATIDLGCATPERKQHLVYERGDQVLSKLISEVIFVRESQVLGIIPKVLQPLGYLPNPPIGEELVVSNMQERIYEILNHANVFVFFSGDLATLEALIKIASWAHLNIHKKTHKFVKC